MYEGRLFINGKYAQCESGLQFPTVNPATEDIIVQVDEAGVEDVNLAVAGAADAFKKWSLLSPSDRGAAIWQVAERIEAASEDLAALDCVDSGKTISDAREDVHAAIGMFRYFAGLADKVEGTTIPAQNDKLVYTAREPYGVVGAITAWNYPLFNASAKIAPVIAMGNACVLKPAEETPLTALKLAELIASVEEIPEGLVNVINGPGETTGALLVEHNGVAKVTFTGSTDTGRELLATSGRSNIKGLTLELGGKAPVVILEDANLEAAANAVVFSAFYNQGQTCTAATRVIVAEGVHDELLDLLTTKAQSVTAGDPADESTIVGPLISKVQFEKVIGYIERAASSGHSPVIGGYKPDPDKPGYFLSPTIYDSVVPDSELFQDEIFGPVLTITSFATEEDAVALANQTSYGLAASVWTRNVFKIHGFAKSLRAGIIWTNTLFSEFPGAPAGGIGYSGFGREYGREAITEYTQVKTVWVNLTDEYDAWV